MMEIGAADVNEHQGLFLTQAGLAVLKGEQKVLIRADRLDVRAKTVKKAAPETFDYDTELFETLRALRFEIAQEQGVPPYVVFGDKTLKEMAAARPQTKEAMLAVGGVGEVKFERYGAQFLVLLQS